VVSGRVGMECWVEGIAPSFFSKYPYTAVSWDGEGWKVGSVQRAISCHLISSHALGFYSIVMFFKQCLYMEKFFYDIGGTHS